jgi:diguanylate cyclase (GGDEF)-like protein/PAS domain S-box-containing protein
MEYRERQLWKGTVERTDWLPGVFAGAGQAIFAETLEGVIVLWNDAAERLLGYMKSEILGKSSSLLVPTDRTEEANNFRSLLDAGEHSLSIDTIRVSRDGNPVDLALCISSVRHADGTLLGIATIAQDRTEQRHAQEALMHRAMHDPLTGLPNRGLLRDRVGQALLQARRTQTSAALLLMDLDHFKEINDSMGHHVGDLVLRQVASRLRAVLRDTDTVARLGGDEFVVVLPSTNMAGAISSQRKIQAALGVPFNADGKRITSSATIGIALFPQHGDDVDTVLVHADTAMYAARRDRLPFSLYDPARDPFNADRQSLIGELRHAIRHGELLLHYQPKASIRTHDVHHLEALVRWQHPRHGLLPPSDFIPLAEQAGLIEPLTRWVLQAAAHQCAAWRRAGHRVTVAVNLSVSSIHSPNLVDTVASALRTARLEPSGLQLEITESMLIANPERAMTVLTMLHNTGVKIAIDDFGTGYSSLAYLRQLPIDAIKIDRSFVSEMTTNNNDAVIVRSVIDLGHNLGLEVIAEGVETEDVWDMLRSHGCDLGQGNYISPPVSADDTVLSIH